MKKIQAILEKYSFPIYSIGSKLDETEWGKMEVAKTYLKKYWLSDIAYKKYWEFLHSFIFDLNKHLPNMIYRKDFQFISLLGGVPFEQNDFEKLQTCMQSIGEKKFVIIQDTFEPEPNQSDVALKIKYPVNVDWNELMSGNFISAALFEFSGNNYYIFGDSGKWGMYVATEYIDETVNPAGTPINIIGFDPAYSNIFRDVFQIPDGEYCENVDYIPQEERPNLKEWVPEAYRE